MDPTQTIVITDHATSRVRGRLGWTTATMHRMAATVLRDGVRYAETAGELKRFLAAGMIKHRAGNQARIYGHDLFVFQDITLITVIHLPARFHAVVDKIRRQRHE